ncbi:MAG: NAD(P)-dependent oxidoreductase [Clostridia bacterium]|nr:NAD(P)-dependent oxidoreductase [Clostridia bacterium]
MRIAVSGGTGMIASALLRYALLNGHEAIAIVRPSSSRMQNLPAGVKILSCDLKDYASFAPQEKVDVFFHLAWAKTSVFGRDDVRTQEENIAYTLGAVELAHRMGAKCFVGAGSQAEYGRKEEKIGSFTPVNPESGYGIAKYAAGKLSFLACDKLGIRHCWTRILSVFGKGDAPTTLISYLAQCMKGGESPCLTPCEQIWDYLYVEDAARALFLIGEKGVHGKTYPVGSGKGAPLSEYVLTMRSLLAPDLPISFGGKAYYPHQPMYLVADLSELTKDTGFVPAYSFAEGIAEAYL